MAARTPVRSGHRTRLAALLVVAILMTTLVACRTATAGARCRGNDVAQDRTHVLACRNGRWVRIISKADGLRLLAEEQRRQREAATPVTSPPAPTPPPATSPPTALPLPATPNDGDPAFAGGAAVVDPGGWRLDQVRGTTSGGALVVFVNDAGPGVRVVRLTASGIVDPTFSGDGWFTDTTIDGVAIDAAGRVLVYDWSTHTEAPATPPPAANPDQVVESRVRRLDASGNVDASFAGGTGQSTWTTRTNTSDTPSCGALLVATADAVVVAFAEQFHPLCSPTGLARIAADGSVDGAWSPASAAGAGLISPQAITAGTGNSVLVTTDSAPGLVRVLANGSIDSGFDPPLLPYALDPTWKAHDTDLVALPDGTVGRLSRSVGNQVTRLLTYSSSGAAIRGSTNADPWIEYLGPGSLTATGNRFLHVSALGWPGQPGLSALRPDGSLDTSFNGTGRATWAVPFAARSYVAGPGAGHMLVAGQAADGRAWIVRLTPTI